MAGKCAKDPTIALTVRSAPSAVPWDALWDWLLAPEAPRDPPGSAGQTRDRRADGPSETPTQPEIQQPTEEERQPTRRRDDPEQH